MYQQGYHPDHGRADGGRRRRAGRNARQQPSQGTPPSQGPSQGTLPPQGAPYPPGYQSGYIPPAYGHAPGDPPKRPPKKKKRVLLRMALSLLAIAVLGMGAYYGKLYLDVSPYAGVFLDNVYIDGIHLGGMTAAEGVAAVKNNIYQRQNSWYIRLVYGEHVYATVTAGMLGINTDESQIDALLNEAWRLGHTGYLTDRKRDIDTLAQTPYTAYTAQSGANTQTIDELLVAIRDDVQREAVDAQMIAFNPTLTEPFIYQYEQTGLALDIEPLREQIYQMASAMQTGDVQVTPTVVQPSVTVAELSQKYALRATGSTPISKDSDDNRNANIQIACEKINGTIIKPGGKFSFNDIVGMRSEKNGFMQAIEYAYGELALGWGGGVCQVSTTAYIAALTANMKITKRTVHSMPVNYTNKGQDATVSYTRDRQIDFAFTNNTGSNIYITAAVVVSAQNSSRMSCVIRIYGESLGENVFYRLESKDIEEIPIPEEIELIKDTKQEYVTYTDETHLYSKGRKGYIVETYLQRVENNVVVSSELVSRDTYAAKAPKYYVGVVERE